MPKVHLLIGPVGAGKSTLGLQLSREHQAIRLTLDEWMARLFRADRPPTGVMDWYVERVQRCLDQIWSVTTEALEVGTDVVLEIGLIQRRDRDAFYRRVDAADVDLLVYVVDAPRDVRRQRVLQRNEEQGETFSMEVPPEIFELASNLWEPPDEVERQERTIVPLPVVDRTR